MRNPHCLQARSQAVSEKFSKWWFLKKTTAILKKYPEGPENKNVLRGNRPSSLSLSVGS